MKNDTYLNLCLEQAAKSPLRYRHGCIVVRGGKVIGQGYNDYRSGYDGGALKSGRLPLRATVKAKAAEAIIPLETLTGGGGEGLDYDVKPSSPTPRPSVPRHLYNQLRPAASPSSTFKSDLETLHLDRASQESTKACSRPQRGGKQKSSENHINTNSRSNEESQCRSKVRRHDRIRLRPRSTDAMSHTENHPRYAEHPYRSNISTSSTPKQPKRNVPSATINQQNMLIPTGQTRQCSQTMKLRKRNSRLNGADIYVARMGYKSDNIEVSAVSRLGPGHGDTARKINSLHDELASSQPKPKGQSVTVVRPQTKQLTALASKPCYRCISYMASVGIRRAFWTTEDGTWDSAKVSDLMEALNNMGSDKATSDPALGNVFVTKHEVLLFRRNMGSDS